jgi:stage V sporulation protein R
MMQHQKAQLPEHLLAIQRAIEGHARAYGLDFWEVSFQILDYKRMQEVAAYGGFPVRYPHWRFGMDFDHLDKSHIYGLSQIYEMVINNNPAYAYLLEGNSLVDQKMVMAHVLGHVDFFKNNYYFSKTNRKMMDGVANHATRVRRHVERYGQEKVESFIDVCLSLDNLIDPMSPFIQRHAPEPPPSTDPPAIEVPRLRAKSYMEKFINPPAYLDEQRRRLEEERQKPKRHPVEPERDVLLFLLENAPLESWERDLLEIIREEAYYFAPQRQTKVLNEGWAAYWHSKLMTERILDASELIDYADHNAGVLAAAPGQFNPYKVGLALLRHIEERWDKGRFGKEWNECEDYDLRRTWDRKLGLGRNKIFEVRALYNDITFLDEFFTVEFCQENKFFSFSKNASSGNYEIDSREWKKIKNKILFQLTNFGEPVIAVEDANYDNRGELLLHHRHEGTDLRIDHAQATLEALRRIWHRPVCLHTVVEGKPRRFRYDGERHSDTIR